MNNKLKEAINEENIELIKLYSKEINIDYTITNILILSLKTENLDIIKIIFEIKDIADIITTDIVVKIIQLENIELLNLLYQYFNVKSIIIYFLDINRYYNFTYNVDVINSLKNYINSYKNYINSYKN